MQNKEKIMTKRQYTKGIIGHARKTKKAFTLAEVLITLTIIGVIAALTIPNLMQKWQDHADVQKVKQAYSILNNAFKLCVQENGTMDNWYWGTNTTFPYNTKNS